MTRDFDFNTYIYSELVAFFKILGILNVDSGSLAQLGEHCLDKAGVAGSSPARSIFHFLPLSVSE